MTKVIVYERESDGGVSVIFPTGDVKDAERDVPIGSNGKVLPYKIIEKSDVPSDREFRNAWKVSGGSIAIDLPIAKEIKKEALRTERKEKLAELDIQYQRAIEEGKSTASIVKEKQRLRDITASVDVAPTLDQVKAIKI